MPLIGKRTSGACPGYTWDDESTVHDLDHDLAHELLSIKDADFFDAEAEGLTAAAAKSRRGRKITEPGPDAGASAKIQAKIDALKGADGGKPGKSDSVEE